jgi:hypothetical protein
MVQEFADHRLRVREVTENSEVDLQARVRESVTSRPEPASSTRSAIWCRRRQGRD